MNPHARLGAFVLVALILLAFATGKIGDIVWPSHQGHIVEAEFDDLLGLDVQSPVRMAGVKIGVVQQILLKNNRALVRIALNPGVTLPGSTRATIIGRGLVGEKNLALTAKAGDKTILPEGAIIPSDPAGDINTFIAKASGITDDVRALTQSLTGSKSSKGHESFLQLVANINTAAQEITMMVKENRTQVREITTSLQRIMQKLETELPQTTRAGRQFFEEGKKASENLNASLLDNRENIYRTLFELRQASENLAAFSDDVRRNPWKLMKEKPEVKPDRRARQRRMEEMLMTTGSMGLEPVGK
ncbi:MlaD family protein [Mariprofundus ferrooxydans]|uniref:Mammalian cell entry-related protein n=1 Tax=Mariprofundus ferrooxydans PV-1 TaxID=314345 RepID=Q0EZD4_9PROT|nr:MlaD family protein [Mariprofundus ferrooxydans]EAU54770.1 Mammalian cell entry-related protein [Mariprofundus ferrooxydans PV-1]KON46680.1 mammalian cell entry protein [Mariprofundus ferrooxydans]